MVAEGSGSWLEYVQFDNKVYWTVDDAKPTWLMPSDKENVPERLRDYLLPSDSQLRPDMGPLKAKDFDLAEKNKHELEEQQRRDKKLRHAREAERKQGSK